MSHMAANMRISSGLAALLSTVWCGPPAIIQASAEVARSGLGRQIARATGSRGRSSGGSTTSIVLSTSRNRLPRSSQLATIGRPGGRVEHQADGILALPERQRRDLAARSSRRRSTGTARACGRPGSARGAASRS